MRDDITSLLRHIYVPEQWLNVAVTATMILAVTLIAAIAYWFARRIVSEAVRRVTRRTEVTWDDDLLPDRVLRAGCRIMPPVVFYMMSPAVFENSPDILAWVIPICRIWLTVSAIRFVCAFLKSAYLTLDARERFHVYPLRGIYQMLTILVVSIGVIICLSIVSGRNPLLIISGLSASAAILMLVFKDTIMGLVAGVQLSANRMLRKGDWIIAPKYGANGEVAEVTLATVKVVNWDNSVTTIPPYALVNDSFQNMQPMRHAGARRVMRSIPVDFSSVRFCTDEQIEQLRAEGMLATDTERTGRVVNLRLFRDYMEQYLTTHPQVRTDLMIMVRQLQPTPQGLPVELYFFIADTEWLAYEHIQADIFDHVYAAIPHFGLLIYQSPTGNDILRING